MARRRQHSLIGALLISGVKMTLLPLRMIRAIFRVLFTRR